MLRKTATSMTSHRTLGFVLQTSTPLFTQMPTIATLLGVWSSRVETVGGCNAMLIVRAMHIRTLSSDDTTALTTVNQQTEDGSDFHEISNAGFIARFDPCTNILLVEGVHCNIY